MGKIRISPPNAFAIKKVYRKSLNILEHKRITIFQAIEKSMTLNISFFFPISFRFCAKRIAPKNGDSKIEKPQMVGFEKNLGRSISELFTVVIFRLVYKLSGV